MWWFAATMRSASSFASRALFCAWVGPPATWSGSAGARSEPGTIPNSIASVFSLEMLPWVK